MASVAPLHARPHGRCAVCYGVCRTFCGRCRGEWYCSAEHIAQDWSRHKERCADVSARATAMPSTACPAEGEYAYVQCVRELMTQRAVAVVRVIMLQYRAQVSPHSSTGFVIAPVLDSHISAEDAERYVLDSSGLDRVEVRYPLDIWFSRRAMSSGAPLNCPVQLLCGGNSAARRWCGTVVVLRFNGVRRQSYVSVTARDLDLFRRHASGELVRAKGRDGRIGGGGDA
ncbi:hypothetical protein C8Q76DRAFT_625246 [Earliella scabrosa]|nr:hypothetical protein C8Q76DRAFT_625246 [Earliella scabrosa]